jgi:hypothetical protein
LTRLQRSWKRKKSKKNKKIKKSHADLFLFMQKTEKVRYENIEDASSMPIRGLRGFIYCPICDKKKEYHIVEYENLSAVSMKSGWLIFQ